MKKYFYFSIYLSICLSVSLNCQVSNSQEIEGVISIQRKGPFNLEEIKVRWKKAALENCTGVPCVVTPPTPTFTCGTSTVSDIDNNAYNTVLIGTQCWAKANLKVTKYNDGTIITDETANTGWDVLTTGGRSDYTGAVSYIATYGYLYNWYAVNDSKKICPTGWHVPNDADWNNLENYLGGNTIAGGKMKEMVVWAAPNTGADNSSGFTALPGGDRDNTGGGLNNNITTHATFWSADEAFPGTANFFGLDNMSISTSRADNSESYGYSVRCLRD